MARKRYDRRNRNWAIYIAIAAIAAVATWQFWPDGRTAGPGSGTNGNPTPKTGENNVIRVDRTVRTDNTTTRPDAKSSPEALKKFNAGNAAFKAQKHLEARQLLSEAVFAGACGPVAARAGPPWLLRRAAGKARPASTR